MTNTTNPEPVKKKGCGCVAKGCIIVVIIAVLLVGLGGTWAVKRGITWARTQTSSSPVEVPVEPATQDEYTAVIKKLDDFKAAESGSGKTLELSAHDLNVLIALAPEWKSLRGKIHVTTDGDQLGVTGSVPLTRVPWLRDQYLNGEIDSTLGLEDKVLHIHAQRIHLNGQDLSKDDLKSARPDWPIKLESITDNLLGPVLEKAKTLDIKDGVITLTAP